MDKCSGVAAHLGSLDTLAFRGLFILFHHATHRFYHEPQNTVSSSWSCDPASPKQRYARFVTLTEGNMLEQTRVT